MSWGYNEDIQHFRCPLRTAEVGNYMWVADEWQEEGFVLATVTKITNKLIYYTRPEIQWAYDRKGQLHKDDFGYKYFFSEFDFVTYKFKNQRDKVISQTELLRQAHQDSARLEEKWKTLNATV